MDWILVTEGDRLFQFGMVRGEMGIIQGISPAVESTDFSKPQVSSTLNPSVLLPDAHTQESANSGIRIAFIGSDSF